MADPLTTEELLELANQLAVLAGRIGGFIVVQAAPPNTLGAIGAVAFDQEARIWYGPKTSAGWGSGHPLTEGASAKAVVIQAGLLPSDATDEDFANWLIVSSGGADASQTAFDDSVSSLGVDNVQAALDAQHALILELYALLGETPPTGPSTTLQRESNGSVTVLTLATPFTPTLTRESNGSVTVGT